MQKEYVHPIHYTFGMLTHAPTLLPLWSLAPVSMKVGFGFFYALIFASSGFLVSSGSLLVSLLFAYGYLLMLVFMSVPQMLGDERTGKFFLRLSTATANSTLLFHGFLIMNCIMVAVMTSLGAWLQMPVAETTKCIMTLSIGIYALYGSQMAESINHHIKPWMVLAAVVTAMLMVYFAFELSMRPSFTVLKQAGAL